MFEFSSAGSSLPLKHIAGYAALVILGGSLGGYAIHEHQSAQTVAAHDQATTTQLNDTRHELSDLTSKVNMLVARNETQPAQPVANAGRANTARPAAGHTVRREDPRYKKLQSQLDDQKKAIEETRNALAGTQGDLVSTRTELTGSIAHTHDELVVLEKRGERNYTEFDISKSKEFQHKGPFGVRLRKTNVKHQYADLELIVDDRNLSQKHVNLYQPVMYYTPDSPQPVEVVINDISKDHIHGYISAPKYRQSELASMSTANATNTNGTQNPDAGTVNVAAQPPSRQKLPRPSSEPNQQ